MAQIKHIIVLSLKSENGISFQLNVQSNISFDCHQLAIYQTCMSSDWKLKFDFNLSAKSGVNR